MGLYLNLTDIAFVGRIAASKGVRINAISPGGTDTERAERLLKERARDSGESLETLRRLRDQQIPLGRMVRPEEIGAMAAFLVSDLSASTTGAEVVIDGGSSRSM